MIYSCGIPEAERSCGVCPYEPICYDSVYMRELYAVQEMALQKAGLVSDEDEDI